MKFRKNGIIFLASILTLNVIAQPENVEYKKFPRTATISVGDLIGIQIPPVLLAEMAIVADTDFLVSMNWMNDTIFRVFKLPEVEYLGSFGLKGRGPREFSLTIPVACPEGIIVPNILRFDLITFDRGKKVTDANFIIKKTYKVPGSFNPVNHPMIINDTMICAENNGQSFDKQVSCFNPKTGRVYDIIEYPKFYKAPLSTNRLLYRNGIASTHDGKRIVVSYFRFPLIQIFDTKGNLLHDVYIDEGPPQIKRIEFSEGSVKNQNELYGYYGKPIITKNFIFVSYRVKRFVNQRYEYYTDSQCHILDFKGNPILKLIIPDGYSIVPSYDEKWIYFISNKFEDKIFKYPLSNIL